MVRSSRWTRRSQKTSARESGRAYVERAGELVFSTFTTSTKHEFGCSWVSVYVERGTFFGIMLKDDVEFGPLANGPLRIMRGVFRRLGDNHTIRLHAVPK